MFFAVIGTAVFGFILSLAFNALFAFVLKICWNHVIPDIFHLPVIGWLQAFCLLMVTHMLFGVRTKSEVHTK